MPFQMYLMFPEEGRPSPAKVDLDEEVVTSKMYFKRPHEVHWGAGEPLALTSFVHNPKASMSLDMFPVLKRHQQYIHALA